MKVALIQSPVWGTYDPPLALAQLSSFLKSLGHHVFVFDINISFYNRRNQDFKNIWAWEQSGFWYDPLKVSEFFINNHQAINQYVKQIVNTGAQIICFSASSSTWISSLELSRLIKKEKKDALIVFGGNLFYQKDWVDKILNDPSVDIVVSGEGELALSELIGIIEKKQDISQCQGIIFKQDNKFINTGSRPLIDNLDILPFLDFESLPIENYDDAEHIALMTSRGCILNCAFCSSRSFWPGFRTMSGERIFKEVKYHRQRYPLLGHVNFHDLLFNANIRVLDDFCQLMIEENFKGLFFWTANAIIRPEMDSRLLGKMKKARCSHLIYGIESGSQRVLDLMNKRYKISIADEVIKTTHDAGIMVTTNFMFGFPGETEDDFKQTLEFVKRNAKYIDRAYPSRTYCALEESSYLHSHPEEFGIEPNPPNHLYWQSTDGKNNYPERLRRCEEFCKLAESLGIEVGCGVQTSVELDRWYNLGHYYEEKKDFSRALDCFLRYYDIDPDNAVISGKVRHYSKDIEKNSLINLDPRLKSKLSFLSNQDSHKVSS